MPMHEITERGPLLDGQGGLREPGYARSLLLDYDREAIRAPRMRIKEWDYYLIYDDEVALALTVDDNGYMGLTSASYIDFIAATEHTTSPMTLFPRGRTGLPASSVAGDIHFDKGATKADFIVSPDCRDLSFTMQDFSKNETLSAQIELTDMPRDSMVIATPFSGQPRHFYYNQKIVGMRASGTVSWGERSHTFDPKCSFAILDWGRGVWTYDNTWYWGGACGMQEGSLIGWNIGYGFGDTSVASENMLFVDGVAHKLGEVVFNIPGDGTASVSYTDPWAFTSDDGRFQMEFVPILDRKSLTDLGVLMSDQHQVFGRYRGTVVDDSGTVFKVSDLIGFAEKVRNKW